MVKNYPKMFEPIVLPNGVVLKNRLESTPSGLHFLQGPEPHPNAAVIRHYIGRAKAGAGIVVITGCCAGKQPNPGHDKIWDMSDGHNQHYVAAMVAGIHACGAKALHRGLDINEFLMAGDAFAAGDNNGAFLGNNYDVSTGVPSAYVVGDGSFPRTDGVECPRELMLDCAEKLADFCLLLKMNCGFDGIWVHGAYRHQFIGRCLSPLTNLRTDEFGGSLEKRVAYPQLVFRKIKEKCGRDFIVELSMSGHDPEGSGGNTLGDAARMAKLLSGYADIIQIKGPYIDESQPVQFQPETPLSYAAAAVKSADPGPAIMAVGGYFYPETCEKLLENGAADMIGMGRAWISNSDYGGYLKAGRGEDLTPCLRCNKCHRSSESDPWVSVCSVNPVMGLEEYIPAMVRPAEAAKKVAVIGGGPAGMAAAVTACDRGHWVTLYEKTGELGGQMCVTKDVPFKWTLQDLRKWLIFQVGKRNIRVVLNCEPTPRQLGAEGYDVVLAAVGSVPAVPPIPGADGPNVMTAVEALGAPDRLSDSVVIVGGGEVGVETGIHLARLGKAVTVLEMREKLAADSTPVHYWKMFRDAWESCAGFKGVVNATATAITPEGVAYRDGEGAERFAAGGTVLIAAGMKARAADALKYYAAGNDFQMIGDCQRVGNIQTVMRSAFIAANQF